MAFTDIREEAWRHTIMAKPPRSASGPDGVSRLDLQTLSSDLVGFLLEICREAEQQQALEAAVSALEKIPGADRVQQYRPITVLSSVYRTYASLRAKEILHAVPASYPFRHGARKNDRVGLVEHPTQH